MSESGRTVYTVRIVDLSAVVERCAALLGEASRRFGQPPIVSDYRTPAENRMVGRPAHDWHGGAR